MSSSKYKTYMAQMEKQGALNTGSRMFFNQAVEEQPTVVSTTMMQFSLKEGLNPWRNKARE